VQDFQNKAYVFARSHSNSSHLYWSSVEGDSLSSSKWQMIGGSKAALYTDMSVAYNTFTKASSLT
jgi:hypothetical protein